MSIFDIMNPKEKAKAAIIEAEKARAEQIAKPALDAMAAAKTAAALAEVQKVMEQAANAAGEAAKWRRQEETIEDALEHAGISGVDVQIDGAGYAKLVGQVGSENDRDTAVAMVEQFEVTGMEVQLDIVPPPPPEPAPAEAPAGATVDYKVKAGESWWGIAQRHYGDGKLWKALKAANDNPRMIHPGTMIKLPPKDSLKD